MRDEKGNYLGKLDVSKIHPIRDTKQDAQNLLSWINNVRYKRRLEKINNAYPETNLQQTQQNKTPGK